MSDRMRDVVYAEKMRKANISRVKTHEEKENNRQSLKYRWRQVGIDGIIYENAINASKMLNMKNNYIGISFK